MGAKHTKCLKLLEDQEAQWFDNELAGCEFKDKRLGKRYRQMLEQLWEGMGESIPYACQDWANTKAAYRFLANDKVDEQQFLEGHFQSTQARFAEQAGFILILHDTTEFSYQREDPEPIGITKIIPNGLFNAPNRCVHIGDRESDVYELFCKARELGTHFLVRTCVDRLAGDGQHNYCR